MSMQELNNKAENYSHSYRKQLASALIESKSLGFTRAPFISANEPTPDEVLKSVVELISQLSEYLDVAVRGYWGNACQTLSSNLFAHLNNFGVKADIVLGNVIVNGTNEYDVTLDGLKREFESSHYLSGPQTVHAWVSLGDDTIVDAALPPRLVKNFGAPEHFNDMIFVNRAAYFSAAFNIQYQPLLVGSEFFAKTNPPDPVIMLRRLEQLRTSL